MDREELHDYEQVKSQMFVELIPRKGNEEMLRNVPHRDIEDLAAVVGVDLGMQGSIHATAVVTNALAQQYGVTKEQLIAEAIEKAAESHPPMFDTMAAVIGIPDMPGGPELYVASVEGGYMGSGVITYPGFLEKAAERIGGDFFVLPSSIHEVLFLKDDGTQKLTDLEEIVYSVNAAEVRPEDQLSDNVYHYDEQSRTFELAERHAERKAEKKHERASVMGELSAARKAEPAHKPDTPKKSRAETVL